MNSLNILITSVLNSASDRLALSTLFSSFSGCCSFFSFGLYFFVSSIWQPPCVCFCVLGRTALIPCKSTCKLYGSEPYVIARVRQPSSLLNGSVLGEVSKRGLCHCLASGGFPGTHPISSHFTHSLYVTGTLPGVALVLNPRVGRFAYILKPCGLFKWSFLTIWQFLPSPQSPLIFTARSYGDLSSWCWNPKCCSLAWG